MFKATCAACLVVGIGIASASARALTWEDRTFAGATPGAGVSVVGANAQIDASATSGTITSASITAPPEFTGWGQLRVRQTDSLNYYRAIGFENAWGGLVTWGGGNLTTAQKRTGSYGYSLPDDGGWHRFDTPVISYFNVPANRTYKATAYGRDDYAGYSYSCFTAGFGYSNLGNNDGTWQKLSQSGYKTDTLTQLYGIDWTSGNASYTYFDEPRFYEGLITYDVLDSGGNPIPGWTDLEPLEVHTNRNGRETIDAVVDLSGLPSSYTDIKLRANFDKAAAESPNPILHQWAVDFEIDDAADATPPTAVAAIANPVSATASPGLSLPGSETTGSGVMLDPGASLVLDWGTVTPVTSDSENYFNWPGFEGTQPSALLSTDEARSGVQSIRVEYNPGWVGLPGTLPSSLTGDLLVSYYAKDNEKFGGGNAGFYVYSGGNYLHPNEYSTYDWIQVEGVRSQPAEWWQQWVNSVQDVTTYFDDIRVYHGLITYDLLDGADGGAVIDAFFDMEDMSAGLDLSGIDPHLVELMLNANLSRVNAGTPSPVLDSLTWSYTEGLRTLTLPWADRDRLLSFDGTLSTDNVEIVSYLWDFGDGSPLVSGPQVTHAFGRGGLFEVTLTVLDANGNEATDGVWVEIMPIPEPATLALLGLGGLVALLRRRR